MKTQKQKRNMKKKYVIKKGAGFISNMSARAIGAFNSARTTTRNVGRSMYQNRGNLLQSAKDVGSSSTIRFASRHKDKSNENNCLCPEEIVDICISQIFLIRASSSGAKSNILW